jgi:hypothetical protein
VTALQLPGLEQPARWQVCGRSNPTARAQAAKPLTRTWAERQGGLFDHRGGGR